VAGLTRTVSTSGAVTGQNFADFPTTFAAADSGGSYYVAAVAAGTGASSGTLLQISAGGVPLVTPTRQVAAGLLPELTFNFNGDNEALSVDFSAGLPLGVNVTLNAVGGNGGRLAILGQGTAQTFTMTDYQIGPAAGGGDVSFSNVDTLDLLNCVVNYSGGLATVPNLIVDNGCMFYWG
jgi:hypothetical protein